MHLKKVFWCCDRTRSRIPWYDIQARCTGGLWGTSVEKHYQYALWYYCYSWRHRGEGSVNKHIDEHFICSGLWAHLLAYSLLLPCPPPSTTSFNTVTVYRSWVAHSQHHQPNQTNIACTTGTHSLLFSFWHPFFLQRSFCFVFFTAVMFVVPVFTVMLRYSSVVQEAPRLVVDQDSPRQLLRPPIRGSNLTPDACFFHVFAEDLEKKTSRKKRSA